MKRLAAVFALMLAGWTVPALMAKAWAVDDALSIEANQKYLDENKKKKGVIVRPSGLQFRIIQNGYGKRPQSTDTVKVYYTGTMINHIVFDGTSPGLPASFKLNSVIPGWIEALQLMREGDRWLLTIPPNLGYGVRGSPGGEIPPNQVLVFDIRLLETTPVARKGEKGYIPDPDDKDDQQQ
jgi:FKBP-type peptidyl-prolyl cis-trans isomerase FklB